MTYFTSQILISETSLLKYDLGSLFVTINYFRLCLINIIFRNHTCTDSSYVVIKYIILPFSTIYFAENPFSAVTKIETKSRNRFDFPNDSRIALIKISPNFENFTQHSTQRKPLITKYYVVRQFHSHSKHDSYHLIVV